MQVAESGWCHRCRSPLARQCYVCVAVSLNMMAHGLVVGFGTVLLPQLRQEQTEILIDDHLGSWIASIVGIALPLGALITPALMSTYGRRVTNLASVVPIIIGWLAISLSSSVEALLVARCLHGVAMGMSATCSPTSIGEYTEPENRGAYLATISLAIATGVLVVHTLGSFMSWRTAALVCAVIAFVDLLLLYHTPETPSWLAERRRYSESQSVFLRLRGSDHEEELQRMIEASVAMGRTDDNEKLTPLGRIKKRTAYIRMTIRKKEFYKPLIIMIHMYTLNQWSGANILASYMTDILEVVVESDVPMDIAIIMISLGIQRIVSNLCAVFVIRRVRRRLVLIVTVAINIAAYLSIALFVYLRRWKLSSVGVLLVHVHMFSIATGTVPLPNIIAGEIFPVEYRNVSSAITVIFLSINFFVTVKLTPFLFASIGLKGTYCLYATVVGYCLLATLVMLPETKGRTLQDIENEFRGSLPPALNPSTIPLREVDIVVEDRQRRSSAGPVL